MAEAETYNFKAILEDASTGTSNQLLNIEGSVVPPYSIVYAHNGKHYVYGYKVSGEEETYVFQEHTLVTIKPKEVEGYSDPGRMTKERLITAIKEYVDDSMEVDGSTAWGSTPSGADCFFRWGTDTFQVVVFQSSRIGMDIVERNRG